MESERKNFRKLRDAVGAFATGVTIVTTQDSTGKPIGVTASSFNSVSLDPPLILWSLAKNSRSFGVFCESGHFAIHVLRAGQEELANRFAKSGADKFANVMWQRGHLGSPVLHDRAALFECRTEHQYEGGDHVIFVGRVERYKASAHEPLLFHGGQYAERRAPPRYPQPVTVDTESGQFSDDFLFYLISRAHYQTSEPTRAKLAALGSSLDEYLVLAALSMTSPQTDEALIHRLQHTGHAPTVADLAAMLEKGLLTKSGNAFEMAKEGRELFVETLAFEKAIEDDLAGHFGRADLADMKRVLRRIIDLTGTGVPLEWRTQEAK